jgi:hypothetical protein
MQAVAMITGDEFLVPYNLTIDTDDVMSFMKNLNWKWSETVHQFHFDNAFGIEFSAIIGPSGYCFNFNLIESNRLFYLDRLPDVFNYSKLVVYRGQIMKYRVLSQLPNKPYPMNVTNFQSGFYSLISQSDYSEPFDVNHHEKFSTQGMKNFIHNPYEMLSRSTVSHQSIVNHSLIVYLNPEKTIIDEALEDYEPKRFDLDSCVVQCFFNSCFRRGCYLKDEKPLKFFKVFTKNNCRSECLANRTVAVCGCAQFFMVRDAGSRVCGVADMKCYKKVEEEFQGHDWCECYLECGEIVYKTEQQQNEFVQ